MTPLGAKLRRLRAERGIALKDMAEALNVSSAYLSALEHGRRGVPTSFLLHRIIAFFNVIWDEAEEIQRLAEISTQRFPSIPPAWPRGDGVDQRPGPRDRPSRSGRPQGPARRRDAAGGAGQGIANTSPRRHPVYPGDPEAVTAGLPGQGRAMTGVFSVKGTGPKEYTG